MTGNLIFGGISAADYGISVDCSQSFATPQRRVETAQVLGRNGDIVLYDPGTFDDVVISYPCFIPSDFTSRFPDFMAHIHAKRGRQALRDSAHPDRYRTAIFQQAITPQTGVYNKSGVFTLQFACAPWWLDSGMTPIDYTESGTIINPTQFTAKPTYYVEGTGRISFGSGTPYMEITTSGTTINVSNRDADHAFSGSYVSLSPGTASFTLDEGITLFRVTPYWWTI